MTRTALFIGGPGNISTGTIEVLLADGWQVAVLTHPKDPDPDLAVRYLWGDRNEPADLRMARDSVKPDVVIDTCCFAPERAREAIDVFAATGRQYVFVSTVDVFGHPLSRLPVRESDEHGTPNTAYALAKAECERLVIDAGAAGRLAATVVRPGYSIGPRFLIGFFSHLGGRTILDRLRRGLPIVVPGDGTTIIQPGVGVDTGRLIARVVGEPRAFGRVFTCAGPRVITQDEYVGAMAAVVGTAPRLVHIPSELLLALDEPEIAQGILGGLTRYDLAYSNDEIVALGGPFEHRVTLAAAIERHLAWLDAHGWPDMTDGPEGLDDRLVRRYDRARAAFVDAVG